MKILFVTQWPIPHRGGVSSHLQDLMLCLRNEGDQADLIQGQGIRPGPLRGFMELILSLGRTSRWRTRKLHIVVKRLEARIKAALAREEYDLIHCHDPVSAYAALEARNKTAGRFAVIETVHGPLTYEARMMLGEGAGNEGYLKTLEDIERMAYLGADRLIAVDSGQAKIVIDDFGADQNKVAIILNSVSCKAISLCDTTLLEKIPRPYILVPRRLVQKNGVHIAIDALARIAPELQVSLIIAGDGVLRKQLESQAAGLNVSQRVIFLGSVPREDVLGLCKNALAVLIPSIPVGGVVEASSIAAIEAMACGTVVIASNIGGLAELIRDGQTGILLSAGDAAAFAVAIAKISRDPSFRQAIGDQARTHVRENLDVEQWFQRVKQEYSRVIQQTNRC